MHCKYYGTELNSNTFQQTILFEQTPNNIRFPSFNNNEDGDNNEDLFRFHLFFFLKNQKLCDRCNLRESRDLCVCIFSCHGHIIN
ncbi:hypothetical protein BLOT_012693 [Blomia tropicalis]|nr:hypothetical protein BLOT_012693 [Blomia tropicalis]